MDNKENKDTNEQTELPAVSGYLERMHIKTKLMGYDKVDTIQKIKQLNELYMNEFAKAKAEMNRQIGQLHDKAQDEVNRIREEMEKNKEQMEHALRRQKTFSEQEISAIQKVSEERVAALKQELEGKVKKAQQQAADAKKDADRRVMFAEKLAEQKVSTAQDNANRQIEIAQNRAKEEINVAKKFAETTLKVKSHEHVVMVQELKSYTDNFQRKIDWFADKAKREDERLHEVDIDTLRKEQRDIGS